MGYKTENKQEKMRKKMNRYSFNSYPLSKKTIYDQSYQT